MLEQQCSVDVHIRNGVALVAASVGLLTGTERPLGARAVEA